ncbi:MAG: MFS transporter [Anaerolineae bacterium]
MNSSQEQRWQIPFFAIWIGQAFSLIGSEVAGFALVWWLTKTTGSATVLTMSTMAAILPGVVLGPFVGALVDRWSRKRVMLAADGFVALVAVWLVYLFWSGSMQVWHLYVALAARSLGEAFHWPAMQASTSLMVPEKHLSRVAGLNQSIRGGLNVVAPPLGALLLELLPLHGIMGIDVVTAGLAMTTLLFVTIPQPQRADAEAGQMPSVWGDVRAGLRYVRGWPGLMAILGMAMIINFVVNPSFSLMPLLVTDHFQGGALQLGWLQSAWGVGVVAGGLLLSVWGGFRRRIYTSLLGMVIAGVGIAAVGLVPGSGFVWAVSALFVAGAMNPLINGPLFAILQATVAPEMQGRIFTLVSSFATAMMPLSLAIAGPLADAVGVRPWYVVGGIVFSLVGVVGFFIPAIVKVEENGHGRKAPAEPQAQGVPAAGGAPVAD